MVTINIRKKDTFLLTAILVAIIGVGVVIAYNSNWETSPGTPSVHGHTPDELEIVLECVSGKHEEGTSGTDIYPSSLNNNYNFIEVFLEGDIIVGEYNAPTITCINGWTMTGCSSYTDGNEDDNDELMMNENTCVGDQKGGRNAIYARCCRLT